MSSLSLFSVDSSGRQMIFFEADYIFYLSCCTASVMRECVRK